MADVSEVCAFVNDAEGNIVLRENESRNEPDRAGANLEDEDISMDRALNDETIHTMRISGLEGILCCGCALIGMAESCCEVWG